MYIDMQYLFRAQICTNEYFASNSFSVKGDNFFFPCYFSRTTYEVEHPWCLYSNGDLLGV